MENEKNTGIQITHQAGSREVSIINGGIRIQASTKPLSGAPGLNWGWVFVVLDYSGSMKGHKIEQAKTGIIDFARDAIKKSYRVGLIKFSDEPEVLCDPCVDVEALHNSLKDITPYRSTHLAEAIDLAHDKLKNLSAPRAMVIATDGMPFSVKTSLQAADRAKADGIDIIAIGTDDAKIGFLNKLASRSELSTRVENLMLAQAISSAALLLESPNKPKPQ